MRAYAARLLAHLVRRSPDAAGQVLEDASAVWRLLGVYTDGLVAASEALGLVSTLLATGAKARSACRRMGGGQLQPRARALGCAPLTH